jgi:hypothetical protein
LTLAEETISGHCKGQTRLYLLTLISQFTRSCGAFYLLPHGTALPQAAALAVFTLFESSKKGDVYNILWALVFGFATLNILSLVSRRFDPNRNRMSFGEMMAVGTVAVAVILLGWEMLYLFKVFPIRLSAH